MGKTVKKSLRTTPKYDLKMLSEVAWFTVRLRGELRDPTLYAYRNNITKEIEVWRISDKDNKPYYLMGGETSAEDYIYPVIHQLRAWDCQDRSAKQMIHMLNDSEYNAKRRQDRIDLGKYEEAAKESRGLIRKMAWELPARNVPLKALPKPTYYDK